jgi:MORN repeat protein
VLSSNWSPRAPLAALTVAAASISLIVPVIASADDSNPAATSTPVNVNSINLNQPAAAASDSPANTEAAAPSASSAAAINPADPNPPNIQGQVILGDGFVYQGSLRDGIPDGKGVKRWPTGDWVYGDFFQGMLAGDVIIHHSDGSILTGTFKHNAPWDAVEKDANGNVIAMYQGGVMRAVTQTAAPAPSSQGSTTPTVQQVRSGTPVSNQ